MDRLALLFWTLLPCEWWRRFWWDRAVNQIIGNFLETIEEEYDVDPD